MNDKKRNIPPLSRFTEIAKLSEEVFHARDLANLWGITEKNTLYTTLKRYTDQGLLHRIHKGFYSLRSVDDIDPLLLGVKALHRFSYVSTETVLVEAGIIQQALPNVTLVSDLSKRFTVGSYHFLSRKLAKRFLYQADGIVTRKDGVRVASPERAIADLLYFNRHAHFDAGRQIDWKKVKAFQTTIGYPTTDERYV